MLYLIAAFVFGLVIATVVNRKFPRTLIREVVIDTSPSNGVFITNDDFIHLVEDLVVRIPNSVVHVNGHTVLFVTPATGKVWSLTLHERWNEVTADYRKVGIRTPQMEAVYDGP